MLNNVGADLTAHAANHATSVPAPTHWPTPSVSRPAVNTTAALAPQATANRVGRLAWGALFDACLAPSALDPTSRDGTDHGDCEELRLALLLAAAPGRVLMTRRRSPPLAAPVTCNTRSQCGGRGHERLTCHHRPTHHLGRAPTLAEGGEDALLEPHASPHASRHARGNGGTRAGAPCSILVSVEPSSSAKIDLVSSSRSSLRATIVSSSARCPSNSSLCAAMACDSSSRRASNSDAGSGKRSRRGARQAASFISMPSSLASSSSSKSVTSIGAPRIPS